MSATPECPVCGGAMRPIRWGLGPVPGTTSGEAPTDAVAGGCVIETDAEGRVAALQCSECGTRTDADGVALERREPQGFPGNPFAESGPGWPTVSSDDEDAMHDDAESHESHWRERIEPYSAPDRDEPVNG